MRGKITKRTVDALQPGTADAFLWDRDLPGFGVRITPAGIRSYVFQYTHGSARRRLTIGRLRAAWLSWMAARLWWREYWNTKWSINRSRSPWPRLRSGGSWISTTRSR